MNIVGEEAARSLEGLALTTLCFDGKRVQRELTGEKEEQFTLVGYGDSSDDPIYLGFCLAAEPFCKF